MIYESVKDPDRVAFLEARRTRDERAITDELLGLAYYDEDWEWVQDQCIALFTEEADSEQCRYMAILCLEHVLRINQILDFERVLPIVDRAETDPSPRVRDAVEFFRWQYGLVEHIRDYLPLPHPNLAAYCAARRNGDSHSAMAQLLALADDSHHAWVQDECLKLLGSNDPEARRVAVLALHEIRYDIHRGRVLPELRKRRDDSALGPVLNRLAERLEEDALDGYSIWTVPDRHALARARATGDIAAFIGQLVTLTHEEPDWRWVQQVCLDLVHDPDPRTRAAAVTCLTDLLHYRGKLDRDAVLPVIDSLRGDDELSQPLRSFDAVVRDAAPQDG